MRAFVLACLVAAAAHGQPVVGPEIRSAPYWTVGPIFDQPSPAIAVARNPNGLVVGWVAATPDGHMRVNLTQLNDEGQATAAVTLPPLHADADTFYVVMASVGDRPLIVWVENSLDSRLWTVAAARVTPALELSAVSELATSSAMPSVPSPANGPVAYVGLGHTVWHLADDGTASIATTSSASIDSTVATSSGFIAAGHTMERLQCRVCWGFPCTNPCGKITAGTLDTYTWEISSNSCTLSQAFPYFNFAGTAVGSDGDQLLVVWPVDTILKMIRVSAACPMAPLGEPMTIDFLRPSAHPAATANPSVAWDGSRFLVVYEGRGADGQPEIRGAAFGQDEIGTPFVIAGVPARRPAVVAAGRGRFLVVYEVPSSERTQAAGRFIDFPGMRRRVVN